MRILVAHVSLQFSDTAEQHTSDIERIFDRAVNRRHAWVLGTEAGPGANNTSKELLRIGKAHGYRMWVPSDQNKGAGSSTDCWLGVRSDLVVSGWKTGYIPVIPGSSQLYSEQKLDPDLNPRWGPKGVVHAEFKSTRELGDISLSVGHHLTKGQRKGPESIMHGVDHWEWNEKLDDAFAKHMAEQAKGKALAFASMDRNASDRRNPANIGGTTSLADELKKWRNTGYGDIDWILSSNKDGRVQAADFTVLDDRAFPLATDHFYLEGAFKVEPLKH